MPIVNLRKVGGSLMVALPRPIIDEFALNAGSKLSIEVDDGAIKLKSLIDCSPKYTLQELLDQCDFTATLTDEEREWLDAPQVGMEVL